MARLRNIDQTAEGTDRAARAEGGDPAQLAPVEERPGVVREPKTGSTWEHRQGFEVLHLVGDPYERGYAHGRLLRQKIRSSRIAEYYGGFLEELYRSSEEVRRIPRPLRDAIGRLMEWRYYAPLARKCMEESRAEIEGLADGAQVDRKLALRGILAPDVIETLAAGFLKSGRQSMGNYYLGGCSTAFARGSACADDGRTYFGRNMDFPGAFAWRYPALIFSHPTEKVETLVDDGKGGFAWETARKQPYLYISTAGFPGLGLTGYSASGVAMGTYVCLSKNIGADAPLFLDYNHYLLTRATSVEGVEHLIRSRNLTSSTPHITVFAAAGSALTVEVDSRQVSTRRLTPGFDILTQTNHFANPNLKEREIEYPLSAENSIGRYRVVHSALEENYGDIDTQRMVDIMSANIDLVGRRSGLAGDFPAQPSTLTSVVFELSSGDFWVADGQPPAVCYNTYRGFNLYEELAGHGGNGSIKSYSQSGRPVLDGADFRPVDKPMKDSLRFLMLSQESLKQGKREDAVRQIEKAIELRRDPGYLYIYALLLLGEFRLEEALSLIDELDRPFLFPHVKASALTLWRARALDLMERRDEALDIYRSLAGDVNLPPQMRHAVKRALRRPFRFSSMPKSFDYGVLGPLMF